MAYRWRECDPTVQEIPLRSQLYLVNVDGSRLRILTDTKPSYNQHSVAADGKKIYAQRNAESFAGIDVLDFYPN